MPVSWKHIADQSQIAIDQITGSSTNEETEAFRRLAVSRSYYGLYHRAIDWLARRKGFLIDIDAGRSHDQVWNAFTGRGIAHIQNKGKSLKRRRCDADYDLASLFSADSYDKFMIDCRSLHQSLDELN